jgi:hypothetical protein
MSIFGCIGKGFSIAKSSGSLILAVFGFGFAWSLINLPFISPDGTASPNVVTGILGVVFLILSIFIQAGSIGYVEQVIKQGKSSLGAFVAAGKKNYFRMFGLAIVMGLMMVILAVVAVLGFVAGGEQSQPSPIAVGLAVLVAVIGLMLLIFLFLAPYAVVIDGKGVIGAMKASAGIVKRNFMKVLLVGLILVAVGFGIGFLLGLLTGVIGSALPSKVGLVFGGFISSAINAILGVVTTGTFMTLYLSTAAGDSVQPTQS